MQYLRTILLVSTLTFTANAFALSDAYYSQGLYMDFEIAEDDESLERHINMFFNKLMNLVSSEEAGFFSIDLNYFSK